MTNLDRLLELAWEAVRTPNGSNNYKFTMAAGADVVIALIERVKEVESRATVWEEEVATWRANVNTLEERVEHWQRQHDRQRADNQFLRDDIEKLEAKWRKAKARLRAVEGKLALAEEVVGAARIVQRQHGEGLVPGYLRIREALRHYDEVKE